ncbi:unnamed protein product [Phytophthora fragariaefolia]|uniref:Unnamed protein product n=1 Tax=Phytophthora fragariaefolia TaxID=1490495 RepID=A0A9W6XIS1_9STRA|nr:unnamed protein product [Phytophthora fragariaefolia]
MADSAQLMHSMLAAMEKQTQLIDELRKSRQLSELKLDGVKMPSYGGTLKESFQLYRDQVEQYFLAKGIDWKDSKLSERILAVLAGSLRYGAAQWYIVKKGDVKSVQDFFKKLEEAFVPPDLQERLRDQMNDLKERQCRDFPDYISKFWHLITQVKEMSELDEIMYFLRGLPSSIREGVQYRRSATLTDAITVALDYDRSHAHRGRSEGARDRPRYRSYDNRRSRSNNDGPVPMEIDQMQSKKECMRRNLCFRCGSSAHRARQCPMQPQQMQMAKRNAPKYNNSGNSQGRKPRMNSVLEEDDQADTIVMDRVTMSVADIQEQADEFQAFMDKTRVEVEETVTAASKVAQETNLCGLQSGFDSGLHAMQPEMVPGVCETPPVQAEDSDLHAMLPNLDSGVCGSPPEQEVELHAVQPVTLVQHGSQPTSTTETLKVNAVKSERKSNLFIKKSRINGRDVRILLDTGTSTNMITPGVASNVLLARRIQAQRFDGTLTPATDVKPVVAPESMDGYFFPAMEFVEWKLLDSHDVIFRKPWF